MPSKDQMGRSDTFQAGQSFGKFYLVQLIGEGGTARIFKALQQPINRIVALKIPSFADPGSILSPDEFLSEATLMARLEHGNVVRIYDFGVHEDKAFICMEHVDGWNLMELADARGPLTVAAALAASIQALEGLRCAHAQGVLHLDLSPANVLVSRQGVAKLSDFGMAGKKLRSAEGRIIGTPAFLSPEHVAGLPGTRQSDLFSFGSLLYWIAAGEPLFDPGPGNSRVTQAIREIEAARAHPPADRLRRLPRPLAKAVEMALRGEDGDALAAELRAAWKKARGDERPEDVLRRELGLDGDPLGQDGAADPVGEDALRDRYLGLREEGRHREAVALLERALEKRPDSPVLRELLASPPARPKSGAATVDVGASSGSGILDQRAAPARPRRSFAAPALAVTGILAVTVGVLAWRLGSREKPVPAPARTITDSPASPAFPPQDGPRAIPASLAESALSASATTPAPRPAPARPAARALTGPRPILPPAVKVAGPAGTRVSVDDTVEWISPGPKGGRPVSPGLVNITLTPPAGGRPISSSLFLSPDTLYVLSLDGDGGFSVARRRR